jgi:hypothetical protein
MGSTGVIRPEFRDALNGLRDRLGVQEEDTKELFLEAVEEKMIPMVQWINDEMERTMLTQKQLSDRRKKDMGQDMFQSGKAADVSFSWGFNNTRLFVSLTHFFDTGCFGTWCRGEPHE